MLYCESTICYCCCRRYCCVSSNCNWVNCHRNTEWCNKETYRQHYLAAQNIRTSTANMHVSYCTSRRLQVCHIRGLKSHLLSKLTRKQEWHCPQTRRNSSHPAVIPHMFECWCCRMQIIRQRVLGYQQYHDVQEYGPPACFVMCRMVMEVVVILLLLLVSSIGFWWRFLRACARHERFVNTPS